MCMVRRAERLSQRWDKMHQVIDERAQDRAMGHVPGGKPALVVKAVKFVGEGEDCQLVQTMRWTRGS